MSWPLYVCLAFGVTSFLLLVIVTVGLRVTVRYKMETTGSLDDPNYLPTLKGLTNSASRSLDNFQLITDVADAYDQMVHAISAAQTSVNFETYLFWSGAVADKFVAAFSERARAGVPVKLLFDSDGSRRLHRDTVAALVAAGCEVRFFRPFSWSQPIQYNHRTHRKLLVIDGCTAFTGGLGVSDEWLGPPKWLDVMTRLDGALVALIQGAFFQNWVIAGGALNLGPVYFPPLTNHEANPFGMVTVSAPIWGDSMIRLLYYASICSAKHRLWLMSPYFLPGEDTIEALAAAARRGVDVRLVVPGPKHDKNLPYFASRRLYGDLLKAGVQIHEYQLSMMHAKAMLVDVRWCTFGSTNFDPRSFFLNSELNVSIADEAIAGSFEAFFEATFGDSLRVDLQSWKARPFVDRVVGALAAVVRDQL